jgi:hypothetical protein
VHLVIPKRASLRAAYQFAYDHRDWISDKINSLSKPRPFQDGMCIPILGHDRVLKISPSTGRSRVRLEHDALTVETLLEDPTPILLRFLKKLAHDEFLALARPKADQIGRTIKKLSIKDMKTRWGSCGTDGRMALSWRLILAPPMAYDYVISHEVAHLKEAHHGPAFWNLCKELSTDFSTGSNWMRDHGQDLMRFGS